MNMQKIVAVLLLSASLCLPTWASDNTEANQALIQQAFDDWRAGQGGIFQLLADDAVWVVAGNSPYSGTYRTREAFMEDAVKPITEKLATPIVPTVRQIVAQGPHVVVHWDGQATTKDGSRYENSYSWHMQLENGRITRVTAFLDTWRLVELMN
ncbi:nuclear transport factor 2 family protein [Ectopseudomonas alcaliphila]|uniref:nuclear transport factor 2 family protein n=1 Tax=Ectopseudomonas alcaliphila TaxID=101564 RepID=UPI00277F6336|nr:MULTISPECIES: nuclear transport factor 2 family protein [Pseudomonas]MDP9939905.1 ketosteroid isomerase-like protein [Pseudomonas sp. 3400]MDR7012528.1 ketosteroid isomerase-like protein [Pseudomonas alcaliphila]